MPNEMCDEITYPFLNTVTLKFVYGIISSMDE